jgi:hypothetical protein
MLGLGFNPQHLQKQRQNQMRKLKELEESLSRGHKDLFFV